MGYSYSILAGMALEELSKRLPQVPVNPGGNVYQCDGAPAFYEHGPEQRDGAIIGTIWLMTDQDDHGVSHCERGGTYRIEPNGTISEFPGASEGLRRMATTKAVEAYEQRGPMLEAKRASVNAESYFQVV